jgi:hypothetical protein
MIPFRHLLAVFALSACSFLHAAENPFIGRFALTIPGGGAGWIGVEVMDGVLQSRILWGGGSVVPTSSTKVEGDTLIVTRVTNSKRKDKDGKDQQDKITETITAKLSGDTMSLVTERAKEGGKPFGRAEFTGKRIPPVPAAPDLLKVKFGTPVMLFNGKDLTGWHLVEANRDNGWSVQDGVLMNRITPGKHHGNLRTDLNFEDFNITLEVRTQAGSNSGVYLRGIYEIQIAETYGKPVDPHNMGALYSRITPSAAAEKPIGEWQTMSITLVDRHVTVVLNEKTIIDNKPVLGCTGGAMTSDELKPGPIMLQGDHTSIDYRNIVLRPVVK